MVPQSPMGAEKSFAQGAQMIRIDGRRRELRVVAFRRVVRETGFLAFGSALGFAVGVAITLIVMGG